jgi:4,5-dihydroxyphthalate decarboxylase
MADLELTLAMSPWDRIQPLISGEVKPEGITLKYLNVPLNQIWSKQLVGEEFDMSEMSFSFTLKGLHAGWGYTLLPAFHNRTFSYVNTVIRIGSGIRQDHPEDLKGKRVGVVDYQMTAALWTRGILGRAFGVGQTEVEWFQGRPDPVVPNAPDFVPPAGVTINPPPNALEEMLDRGELDAMLSVHPPNHGPLADPARFTTLFSDAAAESMRYYKSTGIFPAHHATILRRSIAEAHPWAAKSLLDAFTEAQRLTMERTYGQAPSALIFADDALIRQRAVFGDDPYAYGVRANAEVIDTVQSFAVETGAVASKLAESDLYAAGVLDS